MMPPPHPSLAPTRIARHLWLRVTGVVVIAAMLSGCGHKKAADVSGSAVSPDDSSQSSASPSQSAAPAAIAPSIVAVAPDGGADMRALNHAYIGWVIQHNRRPASFEEFVTTSGIQVPAPPAGKKYVIDHAGFVAIQNQ